MGYKGKEGSALPLVLWILAILSVIALSFSFLIQGRIRRMEMLFSRFNSYLEAYSTIQHGINIFLTGKMTILGFVLLGFSTSPEGNRYSLDGSPVDIQLFNKKTKLSIQDESGLINLRLYNPELIDGILKYFGMREENRRIFFDSLLDWIDSDELIRMYGAEKEYYEKLGYRPRNNPLLVIDEISMVRGMEESFVQKIKPFLVLGKSEGMNPNFAPLEVLMSLPDMTEEAAQRVILFRKNNYINSVQSFSSITGTDYSFYSRVFSFTRGRGIILKASSGFGDKNQYTIICHMSRKYSPPLSLSDLRTDIPYVATEKWFPFEIKYWREQIE